MTTMTQTTQISKSKNISQPRLFSHLNGLALLIGTLIVYAQFSGDWLAFILLLLVPDLSMLGYAINSRIGAWIYNIVHSYGLAILVMGVGYALSNHTIISFGLILMAHVGMDQAVGYGYKYVDAEFSDTHMKRI